MKYQISVAEHQSIRNRNWWSKLSLEPYIHIVVTIVIKLFWDLFFIAILFFLVYFIDERREKYLVYHYFLNFIIYSLPYCYLYLERKQRSIKYI